MALATVRPTKPDVLIARTVARKTNRSTEALARGLTWGADEKILLALAAAGWLATRNEGEPLLVAATTSLLPHPMKSVFDQTRPDRRTALGHVHGSRFPASATMPFLPDTRCTWARSHPRQVRCRRDRGVRSERWQSDSL
jgi:hypothetical protein